MCQKYLSTMSLLLITNIKFMCFVWAALELKCVCLHLVCVIIRHGLGGNSNYTITLSKTPWFHTISLGIISQKIYFSLMIMMTVRTRQHFNSLNIFLTAPLTLNSHETWVRNQWIYKNGKHHQSIHNYARKQSHWIRNKYWIFHPFTVQPQWSLVERLGKTLGGLPVLLKPTESHTGQKTISTHIYR